MPSPKSKPVSNIGVLASPSTLTDTVAANTTHAVVGLSIANTTLAPIQITVKLVKSGGASGHMIKDATVAVGGSEVIVGGDQKTFLEPGDSIIAYASVANSCDSICSYAVTP